MSCTSLRIRLNTEACDTANRSTFSPTNRCTARPRATTKGLQGATNHRHVCKSAILRWWQDSRPPALRVRGFEPMTNVCPFSSQCLKCTKSIISVPETQSVLVQVVPAHWLNRGDQTVFQMNPFPAATPIFLQIRQSPNNPLCQLSYCRSIAQAVTVHPTGVQS